MKKALNGWIIESLPSGWEFRFRVSNGVMEYKTYTLEKAMSIAEAGKL